MNAGYSVMTKTEGDSLIKLTLKGDVEGVRARLVRVIENLGYEVINEQPILARRKARGLGRWYCSFDPLDYSMRLTVGLKAQGPAATIVTLEYEIDPYVSPLMFKGDWKTLTQEAKAIAALATENTMATSCTSCGAEATDDSRFCRRCGAPVTGDIAELDVLRLTAGARVAQQSIVAGVVTQFVALLCVLVSFILGGATAVVALLPLLLISAPALVLMLYGMWHLHRTLNPKQSTTVLLPGSEQRVVVAPRTGELPARLPSLQSHPAPEWSVVDRTTELLSSERQEERVKVPVRREDNSR